MKIFSYFKVIFVITLPYEFLYVRVKTEEGEQNVILLFTGL
jgi:hypothetical protein